MERPILFNTEMVKAILGGHKTQTRRVIKPQPKCYGPNLAHRHESNLTDVFLSAEKGYLQCRRCGNYPMYSKERLVIAHYWKPTYQVGDALWVRETWAKIEDFKNYADMEIDKDLKYLFKCDDTGKEHTFVDVGVQKWKPSIHMPRTAARLFLKVTNVRIERLQDITEEDAKSEGIKEITIPDATLRSTKYKVYGDKCKDTAKEAFKDLWESLYSNWDDNPWTWVIEFERQVL